MSKGRDRMVYLRPDGLWANKRNDASRPSSLHDAQADAIEVARRNLASQGGGELTVKGRGGLIRDKDTVHPGKDPFPPKG